MRACVRVCVCACARVRAFEHERECVLVYRFFLLLTVDITSTTTNAFTLIVLFCALRQNQTSTDIVGMFSRATTRVFYIHTTCVRVIIE